ncbi:dihydroneopterin triphosphate diphosphatase [Aestuariibacter salexigens]|uniref:dihydroneopterin triphosphate diphosphatase n=1 Tax=Aestuariibacter salexigens TaxID=226010 RepID=UPI00041FF544|nr:dihydroneopterin triphosphate diphosphatase [Aestuariibacter salexigens]
MTFKRPESVLVVIYDQHGDVLVLQRNDDPDFWQSVTGALELNELPRQTAKREVREETGIDITDELSLIDCRHINQYAIRPQWQHRYPPGESVNTEYVFALQVDRDVDIRLTEHSQFRWLSRQQASELVWSPSNKEAIIKFVPDSAEL